MLRTVCIALLSVVATVRNPLAAPVTPRVASDPGEKEAQEAANFALTLYNEESHESRYVKLLGVKALDDETGFGTAYTLEFYIGQTDCLKSKQSFSNYTELQRQCAFKSGGTVHLCSLEIGRVDHPVKGEKLERLSNFSCVRMLPTELSAFNGGEDDFDRKLMLRFNSVRILNMIYPKTAEEKKTWSDFKSFAREHGRWYDTEAEFVKRFEIFKVNMKTVKMLQENEQGTAVYGATKFADMTPEEFRRFYLTPVWKRNSNFPAKKAVIPTAKLPEHWDWREHNAVTDVKNQKTCGSCWAFATTANIEGVWSVKKGELLSLSEQELVDCDLLDEGCNGGLPWNAYKEIERLGGLETENDYSYSGNRGRCKFDRSKIKVYINDSVELPQDEDKIAAYVQANGPVAIGINAFAMMFYKHGISHPWSFMCNPSALDHGVSIVGFSTQKSRRGAKPYWIIKNSWGTGWGEDGYYLLYRGAGVCGVNQMVTSVIVH
uniref:Cathepsin F n=1 Tax=Trichuris muris TaxID=70415 RepID=A0A5S6QVS5_TRIMR